MQQASPDATGLFGHSLATPFRQPTRDAELLFFVGSVSLAASLRHLHRAAKILPAARSSERQPQNNGVEVRRDNPGQLVGGYSQAGVNANVLGQGGITHRRQVTIRIKLGVEHRLNT